MFIHKIKKILFLVLLFSVSGFAKDSLDARKKRMEWWHDAHFGLFVHYGLYSICGGEWKGHKVGGNSEWIQKGAAILPDEYEEVLVPQFNPKNGFATEWAKIAKRAGCKYLVFTTKHHEGFSLFDSALTTFDAKDACGRDLVEEIVDALHEEGLRVGFYHSLVDWHHPDAYADHGIATIPGTSNAGRTNSVYVDYLHAQVEELMTNYGQIDEIWWDWSSHEIQGKKWRSDDLIKMVRTHQPNIVMNNRLYASNGGWSFNWKNTILVNPKYGDFCTPEQSSSNEGKEELNWESCMTLNNSWGYSKYDHSWKSSKVLIQKLVDIVSRGGNFLLNVGPMADGTIPQKSIERLEKMGDWMQVNGESIYGTRASIIEKPSWGCSTTKTLENGAIRIYLHVFKWPNNGQLVVQGISTLPQTAMLLTSEGLKEISVQKEGSGLLLTLPANAPDPNVSVIALTFKSTQEMNGLYLELVADDLLLTNGEAVVSWTDTVSGNVLTESEPNVATYISNFANGHAAVHFSGIGSLQDVSLNLINRPQTKHMTLFVVAKPRTFPAAGQSWLFQGQVGSNNNRFRIVKDSGKTTWSTRVGASTSKNTAEQITTNLTVFALVSGKTGNNDVEFFLNGTSVSTSKSGNGIALGKAGIGLKFDIDIAEVLIYNQTLTDAKISEINQYLISKYGQESLFDAWKKKYWGSTSDPDAAFDADPDGDGIKNGLEFIFGLDPKVAGKIGADRFNFDGTTLTVNWIKEANSQLNYEILETDNLFPSNSWTVLSNLTRTRISASNNFEKVEFTKPSGWAPSGEKQKFIRIRVTQP